MPNTYPVSAITEDVEFIVVDDRLRFRLTSGECVRTYAISFHRARAAAEIAIQTLNAHERAQLARVVPFKKGKAGH